MFFGHPIIVGQTPTQSRRDAGISAADEAASMNILASHQLRIVDARAPAPRPAKAAP